MVRLDTRNCPEELDKLFTPVFFPGPLGDGTTFNTSVHCELCPFHVLLLFLILLFLLPMKTLQNVLLSDVSEGRQCFIKVMHLLRHMWRRPANLWQ